MKLRSLFLFQIYHKKTTRKAPVVEAGPVRGAEAEPLYARLLPHRTPRRSHQQTARTASA
ncbi:MAG: hypothetical protein LBH75_02025 [Treponema sp.]|nr:hypothetical protein [Treponema sp.]